jgi:hypothetical protein
MHQSAMDPGAPWAARVSRAATTAAGDSTLGRSTAAAPERAAAIKSSRPHGVSSPLTRITTSRRP